MWSQLLPSETATARRAREHGLVPDIVPQDFRAEGVLAALPENLYGTHILFPRAESARDLLPRELRRRGARVDIVTVYRTIRPAPGAISVAETVASEKIDCIVFTSPSTIRYLAESGGEPVLKLLSQVPIAVIGPVTRAAADELGLETRIMPTQSTIDDLGYGHRKLFDFTVTASGLTLRERSPGNSRIDSSPATYRMWIGLQQTSQSSTYVCE